MSNILHLNPDVDRPCPPWCELKAGHGWDSEDLGGLVEIRGHGLTLGTVDGASANVNIYNFESSTVGDASTFSPVVITFDDEPSGSDLNPGQARQFAALLVLAADQVEAATLVD
jgi:hypothetical protein